MRKFTYGPGLPGYGNTGVDGSTGPSGVSTYFSFFSGSADVALITQRISENKTLLQADQQLPGYPDRTYQTGDLFIDSTGAVYQIDLSHPNNFEFAGVQLASTDSLFQTGPTTTNSPQYQRYTTELGQRLVVDIVYTQPSTTSNYATARNIYGINGRNFSQVHYVNFETEGYHPYTIFSNSDVLTGTLSDEHNKAIAIVKEHDKNVWHFGNRDGGGDLRDVSIYLDFKDIYAPNNFEADYGSFVSGLKSYDSVFTRDVSVNRHLRSQTFNTRDCSILGNNISIGAFASDIIFRNVIKFRDPDGAGLMETGLVFQNLGQAIIRAEDRDSNSTAQGRSISILSGAAGSDTTTTVVGGKILLEAGRGSGSSGQPAGRGGAIELKAGQGNQGQIAGSRGGNILLEGGQAGTVARGGDIIIYSGPNSNNNWNTNEGRIYLGRAEDSSIMRGQIFIGDGSINKPSLIIGAASSLGFYSSSSSRFSIGGGGTEQFRFDASTFHARGNIIAYSAFPSDIRLKDNVSPIENSLEIVLKLDGIKYTRKDTNEKHIGYIAQDVEKYIPEVVTETNLIGYPDEEKYKTINYNEIIPYLSESIKEFHKIMQNQKNEIEELRKEIKELSRRIK